MELILLSSHRDECVDLSFFLLRGSSPANTRILSLPDPRTLSGQGPDVRKSPQRPYKDAPREEEDVHIRVATAPRNCCRSPASRLHHHSMENLRGSAGSGAMPATHANLAQAGLIHMSHLCTNVPQYSKAVTDTQWCPFWWRCTSGGTSLIVVTRSTESHGVPKSGPFSVVAPALACVGSFRSFQ